MAAPTSHDLDVRPYRDSDWDAVYDICVRTGDAGEDVTGRYPDDHIFPDIWAGPYLRLEPDMARVLESGGSPVGYVLGTADTMSFIKCYSREWVPAVSSRYPAPPDIPNTAYEHLLSMLFRPEIMVVPFVEDYPAHLHIDILPGYRGEGAGRRLIESFVEGARQKGAVGVHVGVASENANALAFYEKVGFRSLAAYPGTRVTYLGLPLV